MVELTIYIGNKNYSSWSLRGWLPLKESGLAFDEVMIPLDQPSTRAAVLAQSPSGRVPALHHGSLVICDSLAIGEYLAEICPEKHFWPLDRESRAVARSISAEMHSGFSALRDHFPMNIRSSFPHRGVTPEVQADINRITAIWREQRRKAGDGAGPFLFGHFTIADAMFAPVVSRFRTYKVELDEICQAYADAVWSLPSYQEWQDIARHEPMIIETAEF
ncbi:MAG TPA: glutathione S-transferase family protein [Aliidongia sp.]|nr:glutathione S-transferase family protein [Aliidongia sp.]